MKASLMATMFWWNADKSQEMASGSALIGEDEVTLKTYFKEPDGMIRLQPANPDFEPILVRECVIQGVVIGVMRRY